MIDLAKLAKETHEDIRMCRSIRENKVILAALRKAAQPQWQPIESAPRDGTAFLTFSSERGFKFERVKNNYAHNGLFYDQRPGEIYTHWMPLPSPPDMGDEK